MRTRCVLREEKFSHPCLATSAFVLAPYLLLISVLTGCSFRCSVAASAVHRKQRAPGRGNGLTGSSDTTASQPRPTVARSRGRPDGRRLAKSSCQHQGGTGVAHPTTDHKSPRQAAAAQVQAGAASSQIVISDRRRSTTSEDGGTTLPPRPAIFSCEELHDQVLAFLPPTDAQRTAQFLSKQTRSKQGASDRCCGSFSCCASDHVVVAQDDLLAAQQKQEQHDPLQEPLAENTTTTTTLSGGTTRTAAKNVLAPTSSSSFWCPQSTTSRLRREKHQQLELAREHILASGEGLDKIHDATSEITDRHPAILDRLRKQRAETTAAQREATAMAFEFRRVEKLLSLENAILKNQLRCKQKHQDSLDKEVAKHTSSALLLRRGTSFAPPPLLAKFMQEAPFVFFSLNLEEWDVEKHEDGRKIRFVQRTLASSSSSEDISSGTTASSNSTSNTNITTPYMLAIGPLLASLQVSTMTSTLMAQLLTVQAFDAKEEAGLVEGRIAALSAFLKKARLTPEFFSFVLRSRSSAASSSGAARTSSGSSRVGRGHHRLEGPSRDLPDENSFTPPSRGDAAGKRKRENPNAGTPAEKMNRNSTKVVVLEHDEHDQEESTIKSHESTTTSSNNTPASRSCVVSDRSSRAPGHPSRVLGSPDGYYPVIQSRWRPNFEDAVCKREFEALFGGQPEVEHQGEDVHRENSSTPMKGGAEQAKLSQMSHKNLLVPSKKLSWAFETVLWPDFAEKASAQIILAETEAEINKTKQESDYAQTQVVGSDLPRTKEPAAQMEITGEQPRSRPSAATEMKNTVARPKSLRLVIEEEDTKVLHVLAWGAAGTLVGMDSVGHLLYKIQKNFVVPLLKRHLEEEERLRWNRMREE
ncbi:unnamed protein product [Amoebophrya sp. A120]|nr:unnamed protein product [Amoebophrya sp. A120]|eukprot:GSA120T00000880001.1